MSAATMQCSAVPFRSDNYAYLLSLTAPTEAAGRPRPAIVVDPGEAAPVIAALCAQNLRAVAVLATHHHADHVGGIRALLSHPAAAGAAVICSAFDFAERRVPCATRGLADGEAIELLGTSFAALATPGHTAGAASFYSAGAAMAFTGDTLFLAGCGRLFEGSAEQAQASLQRLAGLPPHTRLYCGHEYTEKNLAFAAQVLPDDKQVQRAKAAAAARRAQALPTVPGTVQSELQHNLFLRASESVVQAATGTVDALACFAALRSARDRF